MNEFRRLIFIVSGLLVSGSSAFVPRVAGDQHPSFSRTRLASDAAAAAATEAARPDNGRVAPVSSRIRQDFASLSIAASLVVAVLASPINLETEAQETSLAPFAITIERSEALALTENQQFVSDVWWAVTTQYFDQSFNGMGEDGWRAVKKVAIEAVADSGPDDDQLVADALKAMLSKLNDPYTRFLPREKFEALTAYATGGSAGIGVQLLENPQKNSVFVVGTSAGGPANAAGIRAGDTIIEVDGESMDGATAEIVAAKLRGEPGGNVDVTLQRESDTGTSDKVSTERLTLTRAKVKVNPVEASTFVSSSSGKKIGLLKVPSFSTETANQIVEGMRSMSRDDDRVDAIAIDLRGNVGGYMPAGVDVAKLFLPPRAHIIAEVNKAGAVKGYDADGIGAETSLPVYVIVDEKTASAAEIFTAALQDNRRALVVGTTKTFGKGRIQNVQPLENGTGVAVTRARYVTPKGKDIHGVGIQPNRIPSSCEAKDSAMTCLSDII